MVPEVGGLFTWIVFYGFCRKVKEKKNLRSHMLTLHSGMPKVKVPCTICGKMDDRECICKANGF